LRQDFHVRALHANGKKREAFPLIIVAGMDD
jgi:hypothetical protein